MSCIPKQLDSSKELHTGEGDQSHTGFSPSMTPCSKGLRPAPHPKHLLQITTRTLKEPDFKFELLPLHSPLLRQSLLVSFPPLIDMLKFSGYPYPIRGQLEKGGVDGQHPPEPCSEKDYYAQSPRAPPLILRAAGDRRPQHQARLEGL